MQTTHVKVVEYQGFTCFVTAMAKDGWKNVVYLSLAGTETATRAIWAALSERDDVQLDGNHFTLERGQKYKTIKSRIQGPSGPVFTRTLVHPHATILSHDTPLYFIANEDHPDDVPPPAFFERLNMAVRVPKLQEWHWLWTDGKNEITIPDPRHYASEHYSNTVSVTPITPVDAFGVKVWKVYTNAHAWHAIIRRHLDWRVELRQSSRDYVSDQGWGVKFEGGMYIVTKDGEPQKFMEDDKEKVCQHKQLNTALTIALVKFGIELHIPGKEAE